MEHIPVLLTEAIELLNIKPDGLYVDGTFGRGGHSRKILERLNSKGRLIAFDKDIAAVDYARSNIQDARFTIIHGSFTELEPTLKQLYFNELPCIDGILLDLGVSSPQIDELARGFSYQADAPLDMRMDKTRGISAEQWLNQVSESELADVLWKYGEERFARRIARQIVVEREQEAITTTGRLSRIIVDAVPNTKKFSTKHKAMRSFQAIRIYINNELVDLEVMLDTFPVLLKPDARIVVISFHSLEDRLVKAKFVRLSCGEKLPKWVMTTDNCQTEFKIIAKKVRVSEAEARDNPRSSSAILRALVKL